MWVWLFVMGGGVKPVELLEGTRCCENERGLAEFVFEGEEGINVVCCLLGEVNCCCCCC